jgi:hypothetical protein
MDLEISGLNNLGFNYGKIDVYSLAIITLCLLFNEVKVSKLT